MRPGSALWGARLRLLRSLVGSGLYGDAQRAFEEYARDLSETLAGLPAGDPRAAELASEWNGLCGELWRRVRAGRAHAAARLARLSAPGQGYAEAAAAGRSFQILG